jgi:hypothetical protein
MKYKIFQLEFHIENDAFTTNCKKKEIARILRQIANRIELEHPISSNKIMDINGNSIGRFGIIRKGI